MLWSVCTALEEMLRGDGDLCEVKNVGEVVGEFLEDGSFELGFGMSTVYLLVWELERWRKVGEEDEDER